MVSRFRKLSPAATLGLIAAVLVASAAAIVGGVHAANTNSNGYTVANNTPGFIKKATDQGAVDPSTQISVTVWLQLQNQSQLDSAVQGMYSTGNGSYHKWLTQDQINASYSPTSQEVNSVENYLSAKNLTVVDAAENNWYIKASGTVGAVENAFGVQIDNYSYNGQTYRSNTADPSINDISGPHVAAITGMDDMGYRPAIARPTAPDGSETYQGTPIDPNSPSLPAGTGSACFPQGNNHNGTNTWSFHPKGSTTSATYTGNLYSLCGYTPQQVRSAYNMDFSKGDGTGQTVVITDAFGDANIATEAELYSEVFGLGDLNSSNFAIYNAPGRLNFVQNPHWVNDWQEEIALDVEWVHSMAPGAHIALVESPNNGSDLDEAVNWAVVHHLGNVISDSWSGYEGVGNPAQFDRMNRILEAAAAQGVDVNFSSGDSGDFASALGFQTVGFPSSSPYATGIGGTSLMLNADNKTMAFQTGWGTNLDKVANSAGTPIAQPAGFFNYGAGGGPSLTFARPSWQTGAGLPSSNNMRMVPDVSMLADPYTGGYFVYGVTTSTGTTYYLGVIGGTSLACPQFSGIMADAIEAHGGVPFGQAAPLMYGLNGTSAITDVNASTVPQSTNVTGSVTVSGTTTKYSASDLSQPLENTTAFYSAEYHSPYSGNYFVETFGADSSLTTGPGWDDTTGVGTPNGGSFVSAMAALP